MKIILLVLFITISCCVLAQSGTVVQAEYFFDTDKGYGQNTVVNLSPVADGNFPININLNTVAAGNHELYIRTKDNDGKWSVTLKRTIEVLTSTSPQITSGEYFIDTDPGYGNAAPITVSTPDSAILQNFSAAISGIADGYHKLYVRVKDNNGKWAFTNRLNIEKYKNDSNYITKAEYFFKTDNGYGNCTEVTFAKPSADSSFAFSIPLNAITSDTLFIRTYNNEGKWSLTAIKNISVALPLTLLNFNVVKQNNAAQLSWQTANEINTSYFNVQRSTDGKSFATVSKVNAKGSGKVNSDYAYADDISQLHSGKIYYRLQMTDKDGKFTYSSIRDINVLKQLNIAVTPNPVTGNNVNINIYSPSTVKLQLLIYNQLGQQIFNQQFTMQAGSMKKQINLSGFASGNYLVRVTDGISIQTTKFIK